MCSPYAAGGRGRALIAGGAGGDALCATLFAVGDVRFGVSKFHCGIALRNEKSCMRPPPSIFA